MKSRAAKARASSGKKSQGGRSKKTSPKKEPLGEPDPAEIRRMTEVIRILWREYPEAQCSLDYATPFQLLIATILSAQCTDERVNKTTPELFGRYPDARAMANAKLSDVEKIIQPLGFFRTKSKSIVETAKALLDAHEGDVPRELDSLVKLRGVGRKTANVVLGNAYGISSGVVVDTHVGRLTRRLGFTRETDPVKVEKELEPLMPKKRDWIDFPHLMIHHGRAICTARKAMCERCVISSLCPKIGVSGSF